MVSIAAVEERLTHNETQKHSGEGSADLGSVAGIPDWACVDFDDVILAGDDENSPHLAVESLQAAGENGEAAAGLPSENRNDSAMQIDLPPPSVPTAVMSTMSNMSSTNAIPPLPDLLHCDRCVRYSFTPSQTAHCS